MGNFDFLPDIKPNRRRRKNVSLDPDDDSHEGLMRKLERARFDAERYQYSVYQRDYDPADIRKPELYPHGKTPPPGKKGWVRDPSDPFKKKKQI